MWTCGWDFLPNGTITAGQVWDFVTASGVNVNASFARFGIGKGVQCADIPASITKNLGANFTTLIVGFAYQPSILPASLPNVFATFFDLNTTTQQMNLTVDPQGRLQFYQNGGLSNTGGVSVSTAIGPLSSTGTIVAGQYAFIEIKYTNSASSGVLQCRVNGTEVINFTGNTSKGGNVNAFILGSKQNSVNNVFDDLYILDTTGSAPLNTFLGPGHIITNGPNADSATSGLNQWSFTSPQGTDWGNAANIPANTAQYDSSTSVGQRMMFRFPAFLSTQASQCLFLNTWISATLDAAGTGSITPVYRSGTTDASGSAINLSSSYLYYNSISTIDPATLLRWSVTPLATVGACEIGVTRTA